MKTSREAGAALRALRLSKGLHEPWVQKTARIPSLARVESGLASVGDMDRVAHVLGTTLVAILQAPKYPAPTSYGKLPTGKLPTGEISLGKPMDLTMLADAVLGLPEGSSKIERAVDAIVLRAIERSGGNQSAAARTLCMDRKVYVRRLARARRAAKRAPKAKAKK